MGPKKMGWVKPFFDGFWMEEAEDGSVPEMKYDVEMWDARLSKMSGRGHPLLMVSFSCLLA